LRHKNVDESLGTPQKFARLICTTWLSILQIDFGRAASQEVTRVIKQGFASALSGRKMGFALRMTRLFWCEKHGVDAVTH
jgi:hypothetical protein